MNAHFSLFLMSCYKMQQAISEIVWVLCDFGRCALNFKWRLSLDDFLQCFCFFCCFYCVCEKWNVIRSLFFFFFFHFPIEICTDTMRSVRDTWLVSLNNPCSVCTLNFLNIKMQTDCMQVRHGFTTTCTHYQFELFNVSNFPFSRRNQVGHTHTRASY